jgi:hypothetical protein
VIAQTARIIFLHAITHWPTVVMEQFRPFAVHHVCTFHNASICSDLGESPHYLFAGTKVPWKLDDFRVFVSPVFVLDKKIQDGDSLPKWKVRS